MSVLITLVMLIVAVRSRPDTVVRNLLVCGLFGATAALSLPGLGGAPVKPALFLLPVVLWWALRERGIDGMLRQITPGTPGFWLALFLLWALMTAVFGPRLFKGDMWVYNTDRFGDASLRVQMTRLGPGSTNLTQSAYAIAAVMAYIGVRSLLVNAERLRRFGEAILVVAAVNVATVVVNLAETYLGLPSVLTLVKNANYAIISGAKVQGVGRISGTFSETAAWASFTLPLVASTFVLWTHGYRRRISGLLCLALVLAMLLSTSTTAYAGVLVLSAALAVAMTWNHLIRGQALRFGWLSALALVVVVVLCIVGIVKPSFYPHLYDFFQLTLWRKLETSSGEERMAWNLQALSNVADTWGLGVGLGSSRASSFPIVLLSNTGVIGFSLYALFVLHTLLTPIRGGDPTSATIVRAARWAMGGALIATSMSATVFDIGLQMYAYAAAAGAVAAMAVRGAPASARATRWRGTNDAGTAEVRS